MIFKKRTLKKSKAEIELDAAMDEYEKKFGTPYHFAIGNGGGTMEETTAEILRMIKENKEQKPPQYEKGADY